MQPSRRIWAHVHRNLRQRGVAREANFANIRNGVETKYYQAGIRVQLRNRIPRIMYIPRGHLMLELRFNQENGNIIRDVYVNE